MALTADATKAAARTLTFALEAELRPLETLISRLRRSDRLTETREAIRSAARRIEELGRGAKREDVADLAGALDAYFGQGELLATHDSFDDAQVVCATVDVLHSKLPGAFDQASASELESYVRGKFQTRMDAVFTKPVEPPDPFLQESHHDAPWSAVDEAIDRCYDAGLSGDDLLAKAAAADERSNEKASRAEDLDEMIAAAFPDVQLPTEGSADAEPAAEPLVAETSTEPANDEGDALAEMIAEAFPEAVKEDVTEDLADAVAATETVSIPESAPPLPLEPTSDVVADDQTSVKPERRRNAKGQFISPKAKRPKREKRRKNAAASTESAPPAPSVVGPAEPVSLMTPAATKPAPIENAAEADIVAEPPVEIAPRVEEHVEISARPLEDSILDRPPASTAVDGWDLAAVDRDAWLEENPGILDNLRAAMSGVKENPADADALLELAAAFDAYHAAAKKFGRKPAAELAGKLSELPWRFAEQHAGAPPEVVELFRLGVRALVDLATGFYNPAELQAQIDSVEQRFTALTAPVDEIEEAKALQLVEAVDVAETTPTESTAPEIVEAVESPLPEVAGLSPSPEEAFDAPTVSVELLAQETFEQPASDDVALSAELATDSQAFAEPEAMAPSQDEPAPAVEPIEELRAVEETTDLTAPEAADHAEVEPAPVAVEPHAEPVAEVVEAAAEPVSLEETAAWGPPPKYEPSSSTNLLALYQKEAAELLATLEQSLLALAADRTDAEALNNAYVTAHTYVGAAATVGFTDCSRVAGYIESMLERVLANTAWWDESAHGLLAFGVELLKRRDIHHSLPSFVVSNFNERCAAWAAAQDAALLQPETQDVAEEAAEDLSDALRETQAFYDDAAESPSQAALEIADDDLSSASGTAFDLLAGVSEAELELPDVPGELLEVYAEEAEEHLKIIHAGVERLAREPNNRDVVQEVRRSAHTLKGAAGAVGLRAVAKLAHRMEDLLDELYEGARTVEPHIFALLQRSADSLGELSSGVRGPASSKDGLNDLFRRYSTILREVAAHPAKAPDQAEAKNDVDAEVQKTEASRIIETTDATASKPIGDEATVDAPPAPVVAETKPASIVSTGPTEVPVWPAAPNWNKLRTPTTPQDQQNRRTGNMLRVPLERVDDLVRLVSELVINRTAFEQRMVDFVRLVEELKGSSSRLRTTSVSLQNEYEANAHRTGRTLIDAASRSTTPLGRFASEFDALEFDRYTEFHLLTRALAESTGDVGTLSSELTNLVGDFDALLNRQGRLSRSIQDRLMRTRMVALSSLASRLERTVRSTAESLGKKAALEFRGDATELDKTVLEEMIDPLLHLLRNCVDHGLESPSERAQSGKPETGRLFIQAFYQGTQVVIQVGDDGRGIDPEKLRAAAVRGGFLPPNEAAEADVESLHQLLFAPGFSTAGEVSEISGRGVGLDVVRSRVAKLKGSITVDTTAGVGTTFSIRLPMTLAIVRSLLVSANGKTFAIPIQAVAQIVRVERSAIGRVAEGRVIFHGGKVFSLFQLGKTLGVPEVKDEEPNVMPVLITYAGSREVAVQVDKIEAAREIVVKTLGSHLRRVQGMIGATLLGDGTVVPILNLPELYAKVRAETVSPTRAKPTAKTGGLHVMVVDDSVSVRRVVSTIIKGQGWTAIPAKDGLDALEQLQKSPTPPDAILLDVEMPRMSGYELLAALRGQVKFRDLPVVMVTSRAGDKHRRKAMELGASEYTVKPFLEDQLVALLRKLCRAAATA